VAALVLVSSGAACSQAGEAPARTPDARGRLEALESRWLRTSATISYGTTQRSAGEATSPHQCLRQLVGDRIDVQAGLRMCSGEGVMILTWDPLDRWRMEGTLAGDPFTLVSGPDGTSACDGSSERSCRAGLVAGPVALIAVAQAPQDGLDRIGANGAGDVTGLAPRTIAGIRAECFAATGASLQRSSQVRWCFSPAGLLLSFSMETEEGDSLGLRATQASPA
jgi:hypothetical protein